MPGPFSRTTVVAALLAALVGPAALTAAPAAAAAPAPRAAAQAQAADGTGLTGLSVAGYTLWNQPSGIAPAFAGSVHDYRVWAGDATSTRVTPTTAAGASAVVQLRGTTHALTNGHAQVPLVRGRNDVTVAVTAAGGGTTTYRVAVWRQAAPRSEVVGVADGTSSVYGGTRATVRLRDGQLPEHCYRDYRIGTYGAWTVSSTFDEATGVTTDVVQVPRSEGLTAGAADLVATNRCHGYGWTVESSTTVDDAVRYTAAFPITRAEVPQPLSAGSVVVFRGEGAASGAAVEHWLEDAQGKRQHGWTWSNWSGKDTSVVVFDWPWGHDPWHAGSGPRTLHAGTCSWTEDDGYTCTSRFSQAVEWVEPVPTDVSFTPASGPVAGGGKLRVKGRNLTTAGPLTVEVGGTVVRDHRTVSSPWDGYDDAHSYVDGHEVLELTVPPATTAGPVQVEVTNGYGTTVARGTYTYAPRPVVDAVAPSAVAGSGGSLLTLTGTGFGTSGRPTVVVGGVKSPSVTRTSATRLTAVVPALPGRTGPVDVTVTSPQGGGTSVAVPLELTAPSTLPTVTDVAPASARSGDVVTLTGTGFGAAGTVGVSVGGAWARVTRSTATSLALEVPAAAGPGRHDVVVGAVTGAVTAAGALTVLPEDGITKVVPATVPSYATGTAARVVVEGHGFGTRGTVTVGGADPVAYVSDGTRIADVAVPTDVAGPLSLVVRPEGSDVPLAFSVRVTAPVLTYVGADPVSPDHGPVGGGWRGGQVLTVSTDGGTVVRLEGTGFGPAGRVELDGQPVTTTSWSDTAVLLTAPAHAAGTVGLRLVPTGSSLSATREAALQYTAPAPQSPRIDRIASVADNGYPDRNEFDARADASDAFTLTGAHLTGATEVVVSDDRDSVTVPASSVTATSLAFRAPRGFAGLGWKSVRVTTPVGSTSTTYGISYRGQGAALAVHPSSGSCRRTPTSGTGGVTHAPATITLTNAASLFGDGGTVTLGGTQVTPTSWATDRIVLSASALAEELAQPWGTTTIVVDPTDPERSTQRFGFHCAVPATVTTTADGSTAHLTIAAGTSWTPGHTTAGFVGEDPFAAAAPDAYEHVTAADHAQHGFTRNVRGGVPTAAGDWFVRVAVHRATYARDRHVVPSAAPVRVTVTGKPLTLTPVPVHGPSFPYRGQLTDPDDVRLQATAADDPVTEVAWEHRDSTCGTDGWWRPGLPRFVALSECAGNGVRGVTASAWDVRVRSFRMDASGTDRSGYYVTERPTARITLTPRDVTVTGVRADRVFDGTTAAPLAELVVDGAVEGDDVALVHGFAGGSYADPHAGVDKPVSLDRDLELSPAWRGSYRLTNPRPVIRGTIAKAAVALGLKATPASVVLSQDPRVEITPTVRDRRTGQAVTSGTAPVVLTSTTPDVCSVSGTTVTALAAGTCVVEGSQEASRDHEAATAASDESSSTESVEVQVFPAPQTLSVVADDLAVPVGDPVSPTSQVSGLLEGDSVDGVAYDFFAGTQQLPGAPTEPGFYRVVPRGGSLTAANAAAYRNPTAFSYVAGTLVITAVPPTITSLAPASGPVAGGTEVTVKGTRLDTVKAVQLGDVTLKGDDLRVSADGTTLVLTTPPGASGGSVPLVLVAGTATAEDVFTYVAPPTAPALTAVPGDREARLTVTPPATDGTPLTGYEVSLDGGATWTALTTAPAPGGRLAARLTDLVNGTRYDLQVRARNAVGPGAPSPTAGVVPATVPGPPTGAQALSGDREVTVVFGPPASDGGLPVTAYELSTDGGATWRTVGTTPQDGRLRTTVTDLENDAAVDVRVRAVNGAGTGPAAEAGVVTPYKAAPAVGVRAVPGVASLTASWAASPSGPVKGYTAYASPGRATCTTTGLSCVLGGEAGVTYTVTVVAHGENGVDSLVSGPSNEATPTAPPVAEVLPPAVPTTLTTTEGDIRSARPSQRITVVGSGFAAWSTAKVAIYSTPVELATVTTDGRGSFEAPVTVPADLPAGAHTFVAFGVDPQGVTRRLALPVDVPAQAPVAAPPVEEQPTAPPAPGAPREPAVQGGDGTLSVSFLPPTGTGPTTRYEVSTDGGATWTSLVVTAGADGRSSGVVTGLAPGSWTVLVRAVGGAPSAPRTVVLAAPSPSPSAPAPTASTPSAPDASRYVALETSRRVLDTRTGTGTRAGARNGRTVLDLSGVVPAGTTAAVLNVTVTGSTGPGHAVVHPDGTARPATSNVNFRTGQTQANEVLVHVPASRRVVVDLEVGTRTAHAVADLVGWFAPGRGGEVRSAAPVRAFDSRTTSTPLRRGEVVVDLDGLVPDDSTSAVLNVTVTRPDGTGYVVVHPTGGTRPGTSNVNYRRGETRANEAFTRLGTGARAGHVSLWVEGAPAAVVVDVVGSVGPEVDAEAEGSRLLALAEPVRALDTRTAEGGRARLTGSRRLAVPAGAPAGATGVVLNVTGVGGTGPGFVTVRPTGGGALTTSNVNFLVGAAQANEVVSPLGEDGTVDVTVAGSAHVVVDVVGYLVP